MRIGTVQAGFTLVELLIALTLGLLVIAGAAAVTLQGSETRRQVDAASRQLERGGATLRLLRTELEHAGYYSRFHDLNHPLTAPASLPDPCATDLSTLRAGLALPVQGYDSPTGNPPPSCLGDADHLDGTDILVIRRVAGEPATTPLDEHGTYLQAVNTDFILDRGSGSFSLTDPDGSTAEIRRYRTDIYFVSPCLVRGNSGCEADADGGRPIPTLKRLTLTHNSSSSFFEMEPLVEGVEALQFDYALDTDGDGTVNPPYETDPGSPQGWADVVAALGYVLTRSLEPMPGSQDDKRYLMGLEGFSDPADDNFVRHVYSTALRLKNVAGRREEPK